MERIVLSAEDFRKLISGKEVTQGNVKIILSDIGFDVMFDLLEKVVKENE